MATKHTPGPWYLSPNADYIRAEGVHGWNIATVQDQPPYTEANAKLIAAAPETLQHLAKLLQEMGSIVPTEPVPESCYRAFAAAVDYINKSGLADFVN